MAWSEATFVSRSIKILLKSPRKMALIIIIMKFLTSGMAELKLNLLDGIIHTKNTKSSADLSSQTTESNKMFICQAVEDRICKRIDLATRPDLTVRQAIDALRLLIRIVRRNHLQFNFSPLEIALLTRGSSYRMRYEQSPLLSVR
jgi:hypothetical protein